LSIVISDSREEATMDDYDEGEDEIDAEDEEDGAYLSCIAMNIHLYLHAYAYASIHIMVSYPTLIFS
jgi:hypothetical protein